MTQSLASLAPPYSVGTAPQEALRTKDGWVAVLLLGTVLFGPMTSPGASLPPVRAADILILLLLFWAWGKGARRYGGFMFSSRIRVFSISMLLLAILITLSTMFSVVSGRFVLSIKDLYYPIVHIRMILIASIMASLSLQDRELRQFATGFLFLCIVGATLAFVQRYAPFVLSGFIAKWYAGDLDKLEIKRQVEYTRVVGTMGNSNVFAAALVTLAVGALAIAIYMKGLMKLVAIAAYTALGGAIIIATASRTGFIALAVVSGLGVVLSLQRTARWSGMALLVLVAAMFLLLRVFVDELPLNPRMKAVLGGGGDVMDTSFRARFGMWAASAAQASRSPLIGVGGSKMTSQETDSGYVITFLRTGLLGFGVYMTMLLTMGIRGLKSLRVETRAKPRMLLMMTFLVLVGHMMFEITGDFFWHVGYGSMLAAYFGLFCGCCAEAKAGAHPGPAVALSPL